MNVAVLDTGVGRNEKDIEELNIKLQMNFINNRKSLDNGWDDNGHGTACARLMHGYDKNINIFSLKVLDENRCGKLDDLCNALDYLLNVDVDVINLSLAFLEHEKKNTVEKICNDLVEKGIIIVSAKGKNRPFPASFPVVLGVEGTDMKGMETYIYDPSADVQIVADDSPVIIKMGNNDIYIMGGTSKATAQMTGRIAAWENDIYNKLIENSMIFDLSKEESTVSEGIQRNQLNENSEIIDEIVDLIPCSKDIKEHLYQKSLLDPFFGLKTDDYINIIKSLISEFELYIPDYIVLGNTLESIYTLNEFVRRYSK